MNIAIATTGTGANVGIGYAVPINLVKSVAAKLRHGPPSWGDAGLSGIVSRLTPDEAEVFRVPGRHGAIIVTSTPEDGPSAGRLRAHDVIFKINGVGVTEAAQAMRLISSYGAGDTVTFELVRHGKVTAVDVTLAEGWQGGETRSAEYYEGYLGMTLEMWDGDDGERGQFNGLPIRFSILAYNPLILIELKWDIDLSERMCRLLPKLIPRRIKSCTSPRATLALMSHRVHPFLPVESFAPLTRP
ncbi:MAG: PDZ domain-containing protein [Candidatus Tectomicrobia bacterium]